MIMLKEAHCADIFTILLGNLKAVVPDQQKPLVEEGQWRVGNIRLQQAIQEKLYYVIAMTSARREDIQNEIRRVRIGLVTNLTNTFRPLRSMHRKAVYTRF